MQVPPCICSTVLAANTGLVVPVIISLALSRRGCVQGPGTQLMREVSLWWTSS